MVEPARDRRLLVAWCVTVSLLTVGIVGAASWTAALSRSMGLELTRRQRSLADGRAMVLLGGTALLLTGVGAARLEARRSLRWGLAAALLVDPAAAGAATAVLLIPLGVAVARGLLRTGDAPESS